MPNQAILNILVELARKNETITYSDLSQRLDEIHGIKIEAKNLGKTLGEIHNELIQKSGNHDLPPICVLVVQTKSGFPGAGFWVNIAKLFLKSESHVCKHKLKTGETAIFEAPFEKMRAEVHNYDWNSLL